MKLGLLSWSHCHHFLSLPSSTTLGKTSKRITAISATLESINEKPLTARERRQIKNERRESNPTYNWREEVEDRLIKKPKKKYTSKKEELNLDKLALLGPQWWVVRVARTTGQDTAERLARSLARNFPDIEFKVYAPAVQLRRKLKNGSYTVKPKPLFPGCVFLRCVLNKEIHDFIRECDGVGGFVGSKVVYVGRQINKPRPVSTVDIEAIFRQAKEEQEKADQEFEEDQQGERTFNPEETSSIITSKPVSSDNTESVITTNPKRRSGKASEPVAGASSVAKDYKLPTTGSTVRVISGAFAEFSGTLKKLDRNTGLATVGFTLFGKETLADLDVSEIVLEMD